ncbi:MAG: A24 family peptidase [Stagnimonas sp.]|nr:A24 family peptidase [Stagnimonas sp.]
MDLVALLSGYPELLIGLTALLGLLVGSFLNVVIYRLPRIMEQRWQQEARDILAVEADAAAAARLSLSHPPSRCPACGVAIKPWQNIPALSWLLLRGRAACCGVRISARYPLVELLTALVSAACAWRFGYGMELGGALLLTWALVALAFIDLDTQLLPDDITLPLLWLGLLFALVGGFVPLESAVIGAIAGYLALWLVFWAFKLATGKEGLGYGDFKLLAALGAWLGWAALPQIILLSSIVGALSGILLIVLRRQQRGAAMPFGPFLAAAGWLALMGVDVLAPVTGLQ